MTPKNKAQLIGALNPKAWDALIPHGPIVINDYLVELCVADAVKSASAGIADKNLKKQGVALSGKIASRATQGMLASWEDGDDICPPWPWPKKWPFPFPPKDLMSSFTPIPDPWVPWKIATLEQAELASTFIELSSLTMEKDFNTEIKGLAVSVAQGVSSQFADEVEKCGTVPREHWGGGGPKPHGIAAKTAETIVG